MESIEGFAEELGKEEQAGKKPEEKVKIFTDKKTDKDKISNKELKDFVEKIREQYMKAKDLNELTNLIYILHPEKSLENIYEDKNYVKSILINVQPDKLRKFGEDLKIKISTLLDNADKLRERQKTIDELLETGIFGIPYDRIIEKQKDPITGREKEVVVKYKFNRKQRVEANILLSTILNILTALNNISGGKTILDYINDLKIHQLAQRQNLIKKKEIVFGPKDKDEFKGKSLQEKERFLRNRAIYNAYKNQKLGLKIMFSEELPEYIKPLSAKRFEKYRTVPSNKQVAKTEKMTGIRDIRKAMAESGINKPETLQNYVDIEYEKLNPQDITFQPPPGSEFEKKRLADIAGHDEKIKKQLQEENEKLRRRLQKYEIEAAKLKK